jgi:hypothetical protein
MTPSCHCVNTIVIQCIFVHVLPADIRTAFKAKDDDYVKLLKRQAADVDAMLSAMGLQLSEMTAAYREELETVEGVLMQVCVFAAAAATALAAAAQVAF